MTGTRHNTHPVSAVLRMKPGVLCFHEGSRTVGAILHLTVVPHIQSLVFLGLQVQGGSYDYKGRDRSVRTGGQHVNSLHHLER